MSHGIVSTTYVAVGLLVVRQLRIFAGNPRMQTNTAHVAIRPTLLDT